MQHRLLIFVLVLTTSILPPAGWYLALGFIVYDWMFDKEDEEQADAELREVYRLLDEAVEELEEIEQRQYQEKKDARFKRFLEEGERI